MTAVKQLFEILQKHNRMDLLHFDVNTKLVDGKVVFSSDEPIEENDMLTCNYYFYYHLDPEFPKSNILRAIEEKDFETFRPIYDEWEYSHNLCYLPSHVCLTNETKDTPIGSVDGIWLKDIFELIDFAEYECG